MGNVLMILGIVFGSLIGLWWLTAFIATIWTRTALHITEDFYKERIAATTISLEELGKKLEEELSKDLNNKED